MKRFISQLIVLVSIAFLAASCQKTPFITMNTPNSFTFTREGGSQSITFSCNYPWSVTTSESWIQVSPSSGAESGEAVTVKLTCAANTTYDPRSATVTIKVDELTQTISVNQETGLGLIVSPTTLELTNAAQTIEIEVQKNVQYTVAIDDASAAWIKQGGTKALTTDKITFTIAANTSYDNREGKIVFKQLDGNLTQTVTIRQSQTNGLFITTPEYNLSNGAHTLSVEVKANVEFAVTSQADWITYVETKALKASTIVLSIPANESYDNRTGTVLVKQTNGDLSGIITINQKQTDYLTVTPTSFSVSNQAQTVEIEVKDNVSYSVVIPDDAKSWISVFSNTQTKALTDDKVTLSIAQNTTYDDREASVTIKQTDGSLAGTVKITQAYGEGLIPDQTTFEINRYGGSLDIGVQANVDYEVTTEANWIHYVETKALTASTVVLTIDENPTYTPREATVSIKQKTGGLVADVTVKQTPFGTVEFEGYTYKTIKYGDREWFAENLRAKFGQEEPNSLNQWGDGVKPQETYFWAIENSEMLYSLDGLMFATKLSGKNICPDGWHVTTSEDWKQMLSVAQSTSAKPFVRVSDGGSDDYSFGGNYGTWHSSSSWVDLFIFSMMQEWIEINETEGVKVEEHAFDGPYPSAHFRHIRCVKGPVEPEILTLPVIKQTTTSAELRLELINDPNAKYFGTRDLILHSKITKIVFKYGTSIDNLSSSVETKDAGWTANISALTPGTTYYYRPEVEYEGGTAPIIGNTMSFRTYSGILEYQGETYFTTTYGNVEFMSQNLRSTSLNDGEAIPLLSSSSDWLAAEGPGQCIAFNKNEYLEPFGRLYNGYVIQTGKICPEGWRLPKYSEVFLGEHSLETGSVFQADANYWGYGVFCNNDSALSLLPSGYRSSAERDHLYNNGFIGEYHEADFWALNDSDNNSLNAICGIAQIGSEGSLGPFWPNNSTLTTTGFAVRCVREK